jgi:putative methyltransferase (TIGR04325 family)
MTVAPVVLFTYSRLEHTRRTVQALQKNLLANKSDLIIFSDAAKSDKQVKSVDEVRRYIRKLDGFKSVTIVERESNLGLANSIISGVTSTINSHGRVIVLEDDLVTSPYFLTYMNQALEKYAADDLVACIHGYSYPVKGLLPEAFFLRGADCWGWATWRRAWSDFKLDGRYLLEELKRQNLVDEFDFKGTYPFSKMLEDQINGKNDSWAVRWYASAFLANKLTLYPGRSLVHNIGNDNSGIHCSESTNYDTTPSKTPIDLDNILVEPSPEGRLAFEEFFKGPPQPILKRVVNKAISIVTLESIKAIAKDWLPAVILQWARRVVQRRLDDGEEIRFEGNFSSWNEAISDCTGYDSEPILAKVLEATLMVKRGEAAFERDSVTFSEIEYVWPLLTGLMWAAARNSGRLNVLDFGGALGSSYFQNRKFLDALPEVHWNIVEQSHYVEAGLANIQDHQLHFFNTIEECMSTHQPNVILLSSVLQYLESPFDVVHRLSTIGASILIIDRTPFSSQTTDKILVQRVPPSIYTASYPMRVFSEREFINALVSKWRLVSSNLSAEGFVHSSEGFVFSFRDMLLEARG